MLIQRFSRVITDMNVLESEFLEYHATPDDKFPAYFDKDDKPMSCALITFGTKYLHKLIYTLVNLVLNTFLLLIPHSNSYCESIFSAVKKIYTVARHNLLHQVINLLVTTRQQHL